MANSTTSNNSSLLWTYFNRETLDYVKQNVVIEQLGDKAPLPQKHGKQAIWTKFRKLDLVTSAGTEGTPPTLLALTSAQITATVTQYKNGIGYTDALMATGANEGLEKIMRDLVMINMKESIDALCRDSLISAIGTTQYAGSVTALSALGTTDKLTLGTARTAKLTLEANNVGPNKGSYYAFVGHPNTLFDMKTDTATGGWIDVFKYNETGAKQLFNAEAGTVDDIKFLSTTLISKSNSGTSGGAYAYTNLMFGYQPFGYVDLDGYSMKLIHHKPGSSGVSDATDELGSIAWVLWKAWPYFGGNSTVSDPERAIKVITGRSA